MTTNTTERLVVIGGGQAAAQLIEVARQKGFSGSITLVAEEGLLPYQRPPLSKQYLTDDRARDWLLYRPERFYALNHVDTWLGRRAVAIDRQQRSVALDDGSRVPYDKLALVTGARARKLAVPGGEHAQVFYIRDIVDAERLRTALRGKQRAVVIGGGFIGLEAAAVLAQRGIGVTLLCSGDRLIPRLGAPEISAELAELHARHGIQMVMNATVSELRHDAARSEVRLADGRSYAADLVIAGIGAVPNVELAQACGLACNDGIVVDEEARTEDSYIFAAGDCTQHPNALLARHLRLETVHNAVEQGRTAGATIAGVSLPYRQTPWVWSDQYDLRLQCAGLANDHDHAALRGDPSTGRFSYIYFRDGRPCAVASFNQPLVFGAMRRLLNERIPLSFEEAIDPGVDLASLAAKRTNLEFDTPWPVKSPGQQPAPAWGHA